MSMKTKIVEFEPLFEELKSLLDACYMTDLSEKVSSMRIMHLVYTICNARKVNYMPQLFHGLIGYFDHVTGIIYQTLNANKSDLVSNYSDQFAQFSFISTNLNVCFHYFNVEILPIDSLVPDYYQLDLDDGADVGFDHPFYPKQTFLSLSYSIFNRNVLLKLCHEPKHKIIDQIFQLITKDRNGGLVDLKSIRVTIQSLVELTSYLPITLPTPKLALYQSHFELPYLAMTTQFYAAESALLLSSLTVGKYLSRVEMRIKQELRRNELILHLSSQQKAIREIQFQLLELNKESIYPAFGDMIHNECYDDCHRMYRLMSSFQSGTIPLQDRFEALVLEKGTNAIQSFLRLDTKDPGEYMDLLLEVHQKYVQIIQEIFDGDPHFTTRLDKAFRKVINAPTKKNNERLAPELMAQYADMVLKKKGKRVGSLSTSHQSLLNRMSSQFESEDQSVVFEELVVLFKYVDDKDLFQKYYSRMLAKRLINDLSGSEDSEIALIAKLKSACGLDYTAKLQKMIFDKQLNQDLNHGFKDYLSHTNYQFKEQFSVLVLTAGAWPLHTTLKPEYPLPGQLSEGLEVFSTYYHSHHTGRKLNFLYHLFKADITVTYLCKPYHLVATLFHVSLLQLFNLKESYTLNQIHLRYPDMSITEIWNAIKPLIEIKLFLLDGSTIKKGMEAVPNMEARVEVNFNFNSKRTKLKLPMPITNDQIKDKNMVQKEVEIDRSLYLQSVLVRLMKSRQTLTHSNLIAETLKLCQSKFTPSIPSLKKCIDTLIDKGYIERIADKLDTFRYVA